MKYTIYTLINSKSGRLASEFPVASVEYDSQGQVIIDCPDTEIRRKLTRSFFSPCRLRRAWGTLASVVTYAWEEVPPGSQEHFLATIAQIHQLGLTAELQLNPT